VNDDLKLLALICSGGGLVGSLIGAFEHAAVSGFIFGAVATFFILLIAGHYLGKK